MSLVPFNLLFPVSFGASLTIAPSHGITEPLNMTLPSSNAACNSCRVAYKSWIRWWSRRLESSPPCILCFLGPLLNRRMGFDYAPIEMKSTTKGHYSNVARARQDIGKKCASNTYSFKETRWHMCVLREDGSVLQGDSGKEVFISRLGVTFIRESRYEIQNSHQKRWFIIGQEKPHFWGAIYDTKQFEDFHMGNTYRFSQGGNIIQKSPEHIGFQRRTCIISAICSHSYWVSSSLKTLSSAINFL